ncbi:hypothetical protein SK128_023761 [Halocaridina rubra]|uniref:Uncharacterized protein n=1 Tax=Halocaridina rubra TaxID=373956 RepID=A0AAN8ZXT7_HALRR
MKYFCKHFQCKPFYRRVLLVFLIFVFFKQLPRNSTLTSKVTISRILQMSLIQRIYDRLELMKEKVSWQILTNCLQGLANNDHLNLLWAQCMKMRSDWLSLIPSTHAGRE